MNLIVTLHVITLITSCILFAELWQICAFSINVQEQRTFRLMNVKNKARLTICVLHCMKKAKNEW